ncbi:hypothetical protein SNE40_014263 [Patella caerulea]|uniref:Saccharopine dehydrogenase-like C-terminal domain-containing protein n=1 Tax=Patella caerulea TaxID=87958 RepID=A0AAN8PQ84_PATCE
MPGFALEGFPNRDSTSYAKAYGIDNVGTILRGTIRYEGFSRQIKGLMALGLFDTSPHSNLHPNGPELSWVGIYCRLLILVLRYTVVIS